MYSVVTVCQCNHRFVVVTVLVFVCHSHCSVIAIDLACVYETMNCAHQLHGSLSKRNSFQLHEAAINKRGRKERKRKKIDNFFEKIPNGIDHNIDIYKTTATTTSTMEWRGTPSQCVFESGFFFSGM